MFPNMKIRPYKKRYRIPRDPSWGCIQTSASRRTSCPVSSVRPSQGTSARAHAAPAAATPSTSRWSSCWWCWCPWCGRRWSRSPRWLGRWAWWSPWQRGWSGWGWAPGRSSQDGWILATCRDFLWQLWWTNNGSVVLSLAWYCPRGRLHHLLLSVDQHPPDHHDIINTFNSLLMAIDARWRWRPS